jgi:hypothetical protein
MIQYRNALVNIQQIAALVTGHLERASIRMTNSIGLTSFQAA